MKNTNISTHYVTSWKFWLKLVLNILVIWLTLSYVLFLIASSLVFNNKVSWAPVPNFGYDLSFVRNKAGQNISLWFFPKAGSDKVILYLHGNAGRINDYFPELTRYGNVLSPAYPGYHESEGSPNTDNVYETADLAYNWLVKDKGFSPDKIIIFGHSLGGSPAVHLASLHPDARKLILVNVFSSVQSMCYRRYSIFCVFGNDILNSAKFAPQVKIPVRQFVYTSDLTVPPAEGKALFTYFPDSNKKLFELDGNTHVYYDFSKVFTLSEET